MWLAETCQMSPGNIPLQVPDDSWDDPPFKQALQYPSNVHATSCILGSLTCLSQCALLLADYAVHHLPWQQD